MSRKLHRVDKIKCNRLKYNEELVDYMINKGWCNDVYSAGGGVESTGVGLLYIEEDLLDDIKEYITELREKNKEFRKENDGLNYYPPEKLDKLEMAHDHIREDLEEREDDFVYYIIW